MQPSVKAAFFGGTGPAGETVGSIYGPKRMAAVAHMTRLYPTIVNRGNLAQHLPLLHDLEVIFCTWGMFALTEAELDQLPNLQAVFYAGGTVGYFAPPMLRRGVTVVSAAAANAVPVAEFTLGQILLANKGYFRNVHQYHGRPDYSAAFRGRGNYGAEVCVLGAGAIGREVIALLRHFRLRVLVFDPFLSHKGAEALGAEKVDSLEEAFARSAVVSNHVPDIPQTEGMLNGALFTSMPDNATFINTGRGRTVNHAELVEVFRGRPDLTALLDVTDPYEPMPMEHPLRALPNVHVSGHIAGSIGDEYGRIADLVLEEYARWRAGEPLKHEVPLLAIERSA